MGLRSVMNEMGIQMELKRRDSGIMHRAITRKPRVDVTSKRRRYSSRNSGDSHVEDSEVEQVENINIDVCLSIEDFKYSHNPPSRRSKKLSKSKHEEAIHNKPTKDSGYSELKDPVGQVNESSHVADPIAPKKHSQPRPRPKIGLVRAMSVDNVLHRRRPTRDPSFFIKPKAPDGDVKYPDYDAGSQIMESYSEKLQYSAGTPRLSKGKRVRSFFRRLAGSLESLLGIKRKSETASESQDFLTPRPPVRSMPSQELRSPFGLPRERQSAEVAVSLEATMSSQGYDRVSTSIGANSTIESQQNSSQSDVAFHRGNRIYTPLDTMETSVASALITPTPPRKPATKRSRGLRKNKFQRRHYMRRESSIEFTDVSNDWETRSDTDSEGYAFQSNKLTMMNDDFQSTFDDVDQLDDELQTSGRDLNQQRECNLTTTKEVITKRSIPVKISEFRPPGNSLRRSSNENTRTKGPMKALQPATEITMPRSESTGKFDTSKRQAKRKIRRRNSSFVPNKEDQLQQRPDAALSETISFEQIMCNINELANSLDKVNVMASRGKLTTEERSKPNEVRTPKATKRREVTIKSNDTATKAAKDTSSQKQKQKSTSNQLTRNQSWVGKVSHRLDNLIEAKDDEASKSTLNNKSNARPARSKPSTPKSHRKRPPQSDRKPSIIVKEKLSFDELESDFRKFAQQVRDRKISTERT